MARFDQKEWLRHTGFLIGARGSGALGLQSGAWEAGLVNFPLPFCGKKP